MTNSLFEHVRQADIQSKLLGLLGILAALRIATLFVSELDLGGDETQYWFWSLEPAFGYFSKPPMIAWLIGLTTSVCGDAEACVRLGSPLLHLGTSFLVFLLAKDLFDGRTAFWSAITFATLPAVSFSSLLISTDVPLLFFWALAAFALHRALVSKSELWALGAGIAIGFGLLAKYAMMYFFISIPIILILIPQFRWFAVSRHVVWLVVAALLLVLPNILWNAAHDFPTIAHTASNANLGGELFRFDKLLDFVGSQFGVFGPILFGGLLVGLFTFRGFPDYAQTRGQQFYLLALVLPVLIVAVFIAFLSRANANWAAPAYVSATILVVYWLSQTPRFWLVKASLALHLFVQGAMMVGASNLDVADASGFSNAVKRVRGWEELGAFVSQETSEQSFSAIMSDDREIMGELLYYTRSGVLPIVMWDFDLHPRNHYEMFNKVSPDQHSSVLFIGITENPPHLLSACGSVVLQNTATIPLGPDRNRRVFAYACDNLSDRQ